MSALTFAGVTDCRKDVRPFQLVMSCKGLGERRKPFIGDPAGPPVLPDKMSATRPGWRNMGLASYGFEERAECRQHGAFFVPHLPHETYVAARASRRRREPQLPGPSGSVSAVFRQAVRRAGSEADDRIPRDAYFCSVRGVPCAPGSRPGAGVAVDLRNRAGRVSPVCGSGRRYVSEITEWTQ